MDAAVAEQLIIVSNLPDLKRKVLTDTKEDYTVENVVTMGQRIEQAREECDILESGATTKARYVNFNSTQNNQFSLAGSLEACGKCGRKAHANAKECPAIGQTCLSCGKPNHFKVVCRSSNKIQHGNNQQSKDNNYKSNKQFNRDKYLPGKDRARGKGGVNHVKSRTHEEVDAEELAEFRRYQALIKNGLEVHHIGVNRIGWSEGPRATVKVNGTSLSMLVDTGSQVNLIDETTLAMLRLGQTLNKCKMDIFGFKSKGRIPTIGQFTAKVSTDLRHANAVFIVVKGKAECILGFPTANQLNLISLNLGPNTVNTISLEERELSPEQLKSNFPNLFSGKLGRLKNTRVRFNVNPEIVPVRQAQRPIAFHLRDPTIRELEKQVDMGILEKVTPDMGPTPWVSNLVVVPKNKSSPNEQTEIRLTADSRQMNQAIKRTRFPTKTLEDIVYLVNGATMFSKIDLMKAFHQLEIDDEFRHLTTITTPLGLLRYKRLHMGISCASELFSEHIRVLLQGLEGQLNMTDDILVFGRSTHEHNRNLHRVLRRLEESGLTANIGKCQLYKQKLTFFGLSISDKGIAPTEDRCRALKEASPPGNAKELLSFYARCNGVHASLETSTSILMFCGDWCETRFYGDGQKMNSKHSIKSRTEFRHEQWPTSGKTGPRSSKSMLVQMA